MGKAPVGARAPGVRRAAASPPGRAARPQARRRLAQGLRQRVDDGAARPKERRRPRGAFRRAAVLALAALPFAFLSPHAAHHVEVLRPTGGLPPHVVGAFREPSVFQQAPDGRYFVFDRRGHAVHRIDRGRTEATPLVRVGPEAGRIVGASTFDLGPGPRFVVADAPGGRERVQTFDLDGRRLGGFRIPGRAAPRIRLGPLVLNGVGSLEFTGRSILMNQPEIGGLITRFTLAGHPYQTFGVFRATGHEADRDLHLALNSGVPLEDPRGDHYFVFQSGRPLFRKYDRDGALLFERHVEGVELDPLINALPTVWPRRPDERGRELPVTPPTIRTAAVDRAGNLWVALSTPFLYVYDPSGEKIRTVRLQAAGAVHPSSLHFPDDTRLLVAPGCYEFTVW